MFFILNSSIHKQYWYLVLILLISYYSNCLYVIVSYCITPLCTGKKLLWRISITFFIVWFLLLNSGFYVAKIYHLLAIIDKFYLLPFYKTGKVKPVKFLGLRVFVVSQLGEQGERLVGPPLMKLVSHVLQ